MPVASTVTLTCSVTGTSGFVTKLTVVPVTVIGAIVPGGCTVVVAVAPNSLAFCTASNAVSKVSALVSIGSDEPNVEPSGDGVVNGVKFPLSISSIVTAGGPVGVIAPSIDPPGPNVIPGGRGIVPGVPGGAGAGAGAGAGVGADGGDKLTIDPPGPNVIPGGKLEGGAAGGAAGGAGAGAGALPLPSSS
tara:strand:- start:1 stop:570 length:570 start_codon:yes stop_codon:yes gene_type:complete